MVLCDGLPFCCCMGVRLGFHPSYKLAVTSGLTGKDFWLILESEALAAANKCLICYPCSRSCSLCGQTASTAYRQSRLAFFAVFAKRHLCTMRLRQLSVDFHLDSFWFGLLAMPLISSLMNEYSLVSRRVEFELSWTPAFLEGCECHLPFINVLWWVQPTEDTYRRNMVA